MHKLYLAGAVSVEEEVCNSKISMFMMFFANQEIGAGLKFSGTKDGWRRIAHKVADVVYSHNRRKRIF